MAQSSVTPSMPAAKPVSGKAAESFTALKRALNEIASWDMSPNSWDKMQIIYSPLPHANEKQAKSLIKATEIASPPM